MNWKRWENITYMQDNNILTINKGKYRAINRAMMNESLIN